MAYNTTVKVFHSGMPGAPTLNGVAGTMLAVLDACLVDGFGAQAVSSLTVASGIATVVLSNTVNNQFDVHTVALLSGANPSGLNGEKRALTKTATGFTFDATGIADQVATGTINVKLAPAGWAKPFTGTNLAVYRSPNILSSGCYLRVDDTGTTNARVRSYATMTDVNTGVSPAPVAAAGYWPKASAAAGNARHWIVIGDDRTFYVKVCTSNTGSQECGVTFGAGDFARFSSDDSFPFFLLAPNVDTSTSTGTSDADLRFTLARGNYTSYASERSGFNIQKSYTSTGAAVVGGKSQESYAIRTAVVNDGDSGSTTDSNFTYPNPSGNALLLSKYIVWEGDPVADVPPVLRGRLRGPLYVPMRVPTGEFAALDKIDGTGTLAGRKLIAIKGGTPNTATQDGRLVFMDLTGPWE